MSRVQRPRATSRHRRSARLLTPLIATGAAVSLSLALSIAPGDASMAPAGWGKGHQTAELATADGQAGDYTGQAVAMSGSNKLALVGAPQALSGGPGAAYVFARRAGSWQQVAKMSATDGQPGDNFGYAVSLATGAPHVYAVVSAYARDDYTGVVYVFRKAKHDVWKQVAELTASDGAPGDYFGQSVSMSANGSTIVVGAPGHDDSVGAAYIFHKGKKTWKQYAEIGADDGQPGDIFGFRVGTDADGLMAAFSAPGRHDSAGAVYVFRSSNGVYIHVKTLVAKDGAPGDQLGWAMAMAQGGGAVVAGAPFRAEAAGAAYVFRSFSGRWRQQAELTASDGFSNDRFGMAVSIAFAKSEALVGAPKHGGVGAAYEFTLHRNKHWKQSVELTPSDGASGDGFGTAVAINDPGLAAVVASPLRASQLGAAYVFRP